VRAAKKKTTYLHLSKKELGKNLCPQKKNGEGRGAQSTKRLISKRQNGDIRGTNLLEGGGGGSQRGLELRFTECCRELHASAYQEQWEGLGISEHIYVGKKEDMNAE